MNEVTPCCGSSYEDSWISDCCTVEMYSNIDICPACKEHAEATGYICNECGNWTDTLEDMADAERKYGE